MGRKEDIEFLEKFKASILKSFLLKKLILFGSRVNGKTHKWSDFDLIVVSEKFKNNKRKVGARLYEFWDSESPVDFLCYTPAEFNKLKKEVSIVREAVREGIEI